MNDELPRLDASASTYAAAERFEGWRAGFQNSGDVSRATAAPDFDFQTSWWRYGQLMLGGAQTQAFNFARTARHARLDQIDHYAVVVRRQGALRYMSNGSPGTLGAGQALVLDCARDYVLDYDDGSYAALYVPRDLLDDALPRPMELHALVLQGAASQLLVAHLERLVASLARVDARAATMLASGTVDLLVASLMPSPQTLDHAPPTMAPTLLRQMCRYIDMHLSEPDLSPKQIGAFFNVSRSVLYRLFEPLGSVANYIRERRLSRIHALLLNSEKRPYVGKIAQEHGFNNVEHFGRVFRERFGHAPLSVWNERHVGQDAGGAGKSPHGASETDFSYWLRSLRD